MQGNCAVLKEGKDVGVLKGRRVILAIGDYSDFSSQRVRDIFILVRKLVKN
jgi:hypothetical protein